MLGGANKIKCINNNSKETLTTNSKTTSTTTLKKSKILYSWSVAAIAKLMFLKLNWFDDFRDNLWK